jgi:hypothetical protein
MKKALKLANKIICIIAGFVVVGSLLLFIMFFLWLFFCAFPRICNFFIWTVALTGINQKKRKTLCFLRKTKSRINALESCFDNGEPSVDDDNMSWAYTLERLADRLLPVFAKLEKKSKKLEIAAWRVNTALWLAAR